MISMSHRHIATLNRLVERIFSFVLNDPRKAIHLFPKDILDILKSQHVPVLDRFLEESKEPKVTEAQTMIILGE
jgi:hypothetical protein